MRLERAQYGKDIALEPEDLAQEHERTAAALSALQHVALSPRRIGAIAKTALVLNKTWH
ncbi:hypothetical protein [Saccharothrix xinjiangensis]|uniref:Uncharacterized protein n=1 Tax=Saccharothrix xinjiangensis TaxID=204798 RepID=A0ABV9YDH5_9PSEU